MFQVSTDPCRQVCESVERMCLKLQRLGKLLLPAWPLEIDNEFTGDRQGYTRTKVFDEREREV